MRGAQRQRLRFMESVVFWEGSVRRQRLSEVFHLNTEGLSRDFTLYRRLYPKNLVYEPSRKAYEPTPEFTPQLASGSAEEYLGLLRMHCETSASDVALGLPGPMVIDHVPSQGGGVSADLLKDVTRAIVAGSGLVGRYQSMRHPKPQHVRFWPHALVFSGYRWHVRAYLEEQHAYSDLVLGRLKVTDRLPVEDRPTLPADVAWDKQIEVHVQPATRWSESQQDAIAHEYGMSKRAGKWVWRLTMRECLVAYFLYLHRLEKPNNQNRIELVDPELADRYRFPDLKRG